MNLLMKKNNNEEFKPWWIRHSKLSFLLSFPLYVTTKEYRRWKNAKLTPRKLQKLMKELDKNYPAKREKLVGRDKEYELIMSSISFHVVQDKYIRELLKDAPPPKFFILKGASGTGKSLLAEVCIREGVMHGIRNCVNVQPIFVKGPEVFDPLYGQSARNLMAIFDKAFNTPSIIFIDEFESFGKKIDTAKAARVAEMEDLRVQSLFINNLRRLLDTSTRTILIAATNMYESIREDIRRRAFTIDLDQNITREMLLAILSSELKSHGWDYLNPEEVMITLEKGVSIYRQTQLTPFDIIDACNKVREKKIAPIRKSLFERLERKLTQKSDVKYKVSIEDFEAVARELRGYVEQEKSTEVMSAVLKIKPSITYDDVGGLFGIKEKIFKTISLSLRPELVNKFGWIPPKGFILWGEPGCGKTHISKAIARENGAEFFYAPAAQLLINAKWVGEPEKNVRDLFAIARKAAPSIIFFDEFDIIAGKRKGDPVGDRITAQILTELDGLQPLENVIVIAATNRLEAVDEAVLNRFEPNIIEVPLPRNDAERKDIIRIHLKHYIEHLDPEVTIDGVLKIIKKYRIVSPRVVAEIIRSANRLRTQEIIAAWELKKGDETHKSKVLKMFHDDIKRLCEVLNLSEEELIKNSIELTGENYKVKLYHFEKAAQQLEQDIDKELMDVQESAIFEEPETGVSYGLGTDPTGRRGIILIVECIINPNGDGKTIVTGASKSTIVGPTVIEDTSVIESATNVVEYIKKYVREKTGEDISKFDFVFEVVSPLEGASGLGVSGPSLGVAFSVAAISELAQIKVEPTVVMTGKGDIKGNVGPVGGVGWRGAGKFLAALKARKMKINKFLLPKWNYENSKDEWEILTEKNINVISIQKQLEAWLYSLNVTEEELINKLSLHIQSLKFKPVTYHEIKA
ncbi:MAG: AAA family ATPase [Candidatus Bathyarchaeia archaeon]|nr:AAA family ATPase [Candidatus Bathyarchaeota archaeon]